MPVLLVCSSCTRQGEGARGARASTSRTSRSSDIFRGAGPRGAHRRNRAGVLPRREGSPAPTSTSSPRTFPTCGGGSRSSSWLRPRTPWSRRSSSPATWSTGWPSSAGSPGWRRGRSALLRGSYHLYQGLGGFVGNVAMGLIFARLYQRWGRTMPMIIAHSLIDTVAFVGYILEGPRVMDLSCTATGWSWRTAAALRFKTWPTTAPRTLATGALRTVAGGEALFDETVLRRGERRRVRPARQGGRGARGLPLGSGRAPGGTRAALAAGCGPCGAPHRDPPRRAAAGPPRRTRSAYGSRPSRMVDGSAPAASPRRGRHRSPARSRAGSSRRAARQPDRAAQPAAAPRTARPGARAVQPTARRRGALPRPRPRQAGQRLPRP